MKRIALFLFIAGIAVLTVPAATVTVTAPAGGETLNSGAAYVIKWTHSSDLTAANLVRLQLFRNTTKVGEIQVNIPVTQKSYSWKVGEFVGDNAPAGASYKIRVKAMDATYANDSAAFTIQGGGSGGGLTVTGPGVNAGALQPKIVITYPHGGEVVAVTQTMNITWTKSGAMSDKVDIYLQYGMMQGGLQLANQVANSGSFSWTIPASVPPLNGQPKYRIFIQSRNQMANKWVNALSEGFLIVPLIQPVHVKRTVDAQTMNGKLRIFHDDDDNEFIIGATEYPNPGPGKARFGFQNFGHPDDEYYTLMLYRSWIYFDLNSLPQGKTPANCKITFSRSTSANGPYSDMRFYILTSPFNGDPDSLHSTQGYNPQKIGNVNDNTVMLPILKNWLANPGANYGLMVVGWEEQATQDPWNFHSCIDILSDIKLEVVFQ
jgi:hypothetical protein